MQLLFWAPRNQSPLLLVTVAFDFVTLKLCHNNPTRAVSCRRGVGGGTSSSSWLQVHPSADIRQDRTTCSHREKLEGGGMQPPEGPLRAFDPAGLGHSSSNQDHKATLIKLHFPL